ncbi:MAG: alpha-hydroxy-acid oxidizing protein [Alphaproteobacteria bacterium]|nr:alpha-hydroxy-acid oxidizing protein [Alphaproteobacteria bacterium]
MASEFSKLTKPTNVAQYDALEDRKPIPVLVANVDLVVVRFDDKVSVLYGRCLHRGAMLADGVVRGDNLLCGVHFWDFKLDSGASAYNNKEKLQKFTSVIHEGAVYIDEAEVEEWGLNNPQPYNRSAYLGQYNDHHGTPDEPYNGVIRGLGRRGLGKSSHGAMGAMGVPRAQLPDWDDIQVITAQLARSPHLDEEPVATKTVIGPNAAKPMTLDLPVFVSDMSFGSLSISAKKALSQGAEMAGTGICSGEGGMLPEEQEENSRYFYELASARFGYKPELMKKVQAFHFKGGQAAKTGTGGHLPGDKNTGRIAEVRDIPAGTSAISPARFPDWTELSDFRDFAATVREISGGIPIGYKMSAQHIENDIDAALSIGVDYIILDGRGGGTGAAPTIFRDNISVPTIPALARARRHLQRVGREDVTLVITGGLRTPADFIKALCLGADAVAISNSALQAIGCIAMRACHTNNCPVGIATQKPHLVDRLVVEKSAKQLANFFGATKHLMQTLARACGHNEVSQFRLDDITTFKKDLAELAGIPYAGVR